MKKIKRDFNIKNNHGKIIETITEELLINKNYLTYKDFHFMNGISGYKFFDKQSKKVVPRFILFYQNLNLEELLKKYDRIEIIDKKSIN